MRTAHRPERKFVAFLALISAMLIFMALPASSRSEEPSPPKVPVAAAMREFQARYRYVTGNYYGRWPKCWAGTAAPNFPSDEFYKDDLEDPDTAATLVAALSKAFYDTGLYRAFLKSSPQPCDDDIAGQYTHFVQEDFPIAGVIDRTNYVEACDNLTRYINALTTLDRGAGVCDVSGKRAHILLMATSPQDANALVGYLWNHVPQMDPPGNDSWYLPPFNLWIDPTVAWAQDWSVPDPSANSIGWNGRSWRSREDNETACFACSKSASRGKFWDNSTGCTGTGTFWYKVTTHAYEPEVPRDNTSVEWRSLPTAIGGYWESPLLGNEEPFPNFTFPYNGDLGDGFDEHSGSYGYPVIVYKPVFEKTEDQVKCCQSCNSGSCTFGSSGSSMGGLEFQISLGKTTGGTSAGYLYLHEEKPGPALGTPGALHWAVGDGISVNAPNGVFSGVTAPQGSVAAQVLTDNVSYVIRVCHGGGGDPFRTFTIENTSDNLSEGNRLTITESPGSKVTQYQYDNATGTWQLETGEGLRTETLSRQWDAAGTVRTETYRVYDNSTSPLHLAYQEINVYQAFPWGEERVERQVGAGGDNQTTAWHFYGDNVTDNTSSGDPKFGKLRQEVQSDGYTIDYDYSFQGDNLTGQTKSDGTRTTQTTYGHDDLDADGQPEYVITTVETGSDQEVSRQQKIFWSFSGTEKKVSDLQYYLDDGTLKALETASWSYAGTNDYRDHKTIRELRPDGTMSLYAYPDANTTITDVGQPAADNGSTVDGTRTVRVTDGYGNPAVDNTSDIATGIALSAQVYSDPDGFGRPQRTDYLDGTHTITRYNCCGIDNTTDRQGIVTGFVYDMLNRVTETTRAGITTGYTYDGLGHALTETRNGSPVKTNADDTAGRLTRTTDALNHTTAYRYGLDSYGWSSKTTTYPDNTTRIEAANQDGSVASLTGTAVHGVSYQYGADAGGAYTKETKLEPVGANGYQETPEWTKTYRDLAGRTVTVQYADGACSRSFYNGKGQLVKQVDPDNVTTLYQYNGKGELECTALDMNGNGQIDFGGTDRITHTYSEVTANSLGINVRRTITEVYTTDGAEDKHSVSVQEISTDGLKSWSTVNGLTTTSETTFDPAVQTRTVTVTNLDNTTVQTRYVSGLVVWSVRKDESNVQAQLTGYAYDALNRADNVTVQDGDESSPQVRTTHYTYTALDQVDTQTITADNVTPQTTTFVYDAMGRQREIHGPAGDNDTGVVYNEYYLTGELARTYGARTYPVSYTYDPAGRMQTMTTYKEANETTGEGTGGAATTTWTYSPTRGWLTGKTYDNNTTGPSYTYTPAGRLHTRTWARGTVTTYGYNSAGDLATTVYSDGTTPGVTLTYDRRGRKSHVIDAAGPRDIYYDPVTGQVDNETIRGDGMFLEDTAIKYTYDSLGRRTQMRPVISQHFRADFNNDGVVDWTDNSIMMANIDDQLPHTQSEGDANGDGYVDGQDWDIWWAEQGITYVDPGQVDYRYEGSRLASISHGWSDNSSPTSTAVYSYLDNSSLIGHVAVSYGGAGRMTTDRRYDPLNRLKQIESSPASGPAFRYAYDYNAANQRMAMTLADNSSWGYGYDARGQLEAAVRSLADNFTVPGRQFGYAYDAVGNRIASIVHGETDRFDNYTTDALNRYTQRQIARQVDVLGETASDQDNVTVGFDGEIMVPATTRHGTFYHKELTLAGSEAVTRKVRVTVRAASPWAVVLDNDNASYNYGWCVKSDNGTGFYGNTYLSDTQDNVSQQAFAWYLPTLPQNGYYNVYLRWGTKDLAQRATSAVVSLFYADSPPCGDVFAVNQRQALDPANPWYCLGNYRFELTGDVALCIDNYGFNFPPSGFTGTGGEVVADAVKFELTQGSLQAVARPATPEAFTYDADGNLLSDGQWTYGYDAENRLVEMYDAEAVLAFAYDYQGRRVRKVTETWDNWVGVNRIDDRLYLYDGWNPVAELAGFKQRDGHDEIHGPTLARTYTWGPDLSGQDQGAGGIGGLLFTTQYGGGRTSYSPAYDGNGNVMAMMNLNDNGTLAAQYEYDPYGNVLSSSGPYAAENPFRFSTKYIDAYLSIDESNHPVWGDTGLLYFGYRYYSPETGRWINGDPIGEKGGMNLYAFVKNRPLSLIDPLGQCGCGPDITLAISWLMDDINRWFALLPSQGARDSYCNGFISAGGWDSSTLALPPASVDKAIKLPECPRSKQCSGTVTALGRCYESITLCLAGCVPYAILAGLERI